MAPKAAKAKAVPVEQVEEPAPVEQPEPEIMEEGSISVQLSVQNAENLPEGMVQAVEKMATPFDIELAIYVEGEADSIFKLFSKGKLPQSEEHSKEPTKSTLKPSQVEQFKEIIENKANIRVEIARYVPLDVEAFHDQAAFVSYHGIGSVVLPESLLEPGQTVCKLQLQIQSSIKEHVVDNPEFQSILTPMPETKGAKAKPVETAPPCAKDQQPTSLWREANTTFDVCLELAQPLVAPWEPPPKPQQKLEELIPQRNITPVIKSTKAIDQFRDQCKQCIGELADEYDQHVSNSANTLPGFNATKQLVFELNKSGKYQQIKDTLKQSMIKVTEEGFSKSKQMTKDDLNNIYNQLYVNCTDHMHIALNELIKQADNEQKPMQTADDSQFQLNLGLEHEQTGNTLRAEQIMQDRATRDSADTWLDYAKFCLRQNNLGEGQEALKMALSHDKNNLETLITLAGLLWTYGSTTDTIYYEQAQVVLHQAYESFSQEGMVQAMFSILFKFMGDGFGDHLTNSKYEVKKLANEMIQQQQPPGSANFYLNLSKLLLDVNLGSCGLQAINLAKQFTQCIEGVEANLLLQEGRALMQTEQYEEAKNLLKQAAKKGSRKDVQALFELGNIYFNQQQYEDAQKEYEFALKRLPTGCPLKLYKQLADCYIRQNQHSFAADVYENGVKAHPCCSTWLGAAWCMLQLGRLDRADIALTEANLHDPEHPMVWGCLMLLSVKEGRLNEAAKAEDHMWRLGLQDAHLLRQIGEAYVSVGDLRKADKFLKRAVQNVRNFYIMKQLADVLLKLHDLAGADFWYNQCILENCDDELKEQIRKNIDQIQIQMGEKKPAGSPGEKLKKNDSTIVEW